MTPRRLRLVVAAVVVLVLFAGYAAAVSIDNGEPTKQITIIAGRNADGSMDYHCDLDASTREACVDVDGHAQIRAAKRDRLRVTVRTDDGLSHNHDFRLQGLPDLIWPAGIEMELKEGTQTKTLTAYATG